MYSEVRIRRIEIDASELHPFHDSSIAGGLKADWNIISFSAKRNSHSE